MIIDFVLALQIRNSPAETVLDGSINLGHLTGAIKGIKRLTFWREHNMSAADSLASFLVWHELHQYAAVDSGRGHEVRTSTGSRASSFIARHPNLLLCAADPKSCL
jgi:hypothetical protein